MSHFLSSANFAWLECSHCTQQVKICGKEYENNNKESGLRHLSG